MTNFFNHKLRGRSPGEIAGLIILAIIGISGLAILFGFVIMWLWNWLMPELFGLTTINYWQGVGLFILLKILTGSCGSSSNCDSSKKSKSDCKDDSKKSFSKWKHYDKFWKEEGDNLYKQYVERQNNNVEPSSSEEVQ